MKEWIGRGTVILEGVEFFVEAETQDGAIERLNNGECSSWNLDIASMTNWPSFTRHSVKENK